MIGVCRVAGNVDGGGEVDHDGMIVAEPRQSDQQRRCLVRHTCQRFFFASSVTPVADSYPPRRHCNCCDILAIDRNSSGAIDAIITFRH